MSARLLDKNEQANDTSKFSMNLETVESEIKNDVKILILKVALMSRLGNLIEVMSTLKSCYLQLKISTIGSDASLRRGER